MPTPSSPPPSEPPSHSFASTCPDDQQQQQQQQQQTLHSPSSWHPHPPPPPYHHPATMMEDEHSPDSSLTADDDRSSSRSRSTTMSPRPTPSSSDGSAPEPEPESMLPRHHHDIADDSQHKQQDTDEVMMTGTAAATAADHDRASSGGRSILSLAGVPEGHVYIPPVRRHRVGNSASDIPSPISADGGDKFDDPNSLGGGYDYDWLDDYGFSMGYDYSNLRVIPTTPSSFLRPGSRFVGTQQSERQVYDVQVEIKHVDLRESFLCGYLRIQGLTEDHPTLTTYFEGEIIGTKYGFMTKHESWGANDRIDLSHWAKFNAFRQFAKQAKKGNMAIKDFAQKENIFMRWKEHFLVPDHRVRTINGASFEGFYYICFNQVEGKVSGIYFHSKSEKFQQLDLKHVEDRGCFGAMEFR